MYSPDCTSPYHLMRGVVFCSCLPRDNAKGHIIPEVVKITPLVFVKPPSRPTKHKKSFQNSENYLFIVLIFHNFQNEVVFTGMFMSWCIRSQISWDRTYDSLLSFFAQIKNSVILFSPLHTIEGSSCPFSFVVRF
jgi:hypothetical protein